VEFEIDFRWNAAKLLERTTMSAAQMARAERDAVKVCDGSVRFSGMSCQVEKIYGRRLISTQNDLSHRRTDFRPGQKQAGECLHDEQDANKYQKMSFRTKRGISLRSERRKKRDSSAKNAPRNDNI
jgi:hypothetical protein